MKVRIEGTTIDTKDILAIGPIVESAYWPKEIEELKGTYYFNIQLIHDYKIQISRSTTQEKAKLTTTKEYSREELLKLVKEHIELKRKILESYWQNNEDLIPICEE